MSNSTSPLLYAVAAPSMSPNPYPNPSLKDQVSSSISRNFPRWTVTISNSLTAFGHSLWNFLVEMFHDAIGR